MVLTLKQLDLVGSSYCSANWGELSVTKITQHICPVQSPIQFIQCSLAKSNQSNLIKAHLLRLNQTYVKFDLLFVGIDS